jgi:hypothetical protein
MDTDRADSTLPLSSNFSGPKPSSSDAPAAQQPSSGRLPSITLPKAGGAIRGLGEKFAVNSAKATSSLSIPIATSAARELSPNLSLVYDSGNSNGPFGLGWRLSPDSITRKTDAGLPKYQDLVDSDVFLMSDAEDLVPIFQRERGNIVMDQETERPAIREEFRQGYTIRRYSPRVEGSYLRIERWINTADGSIHWRTITPNNVTALYGTTENSKIYNPNDPSQVFSWLLAETYDTRGNAMIFQYKSENSQNVPLSSANERNRTDLSRTANRYIKSIKYGNKTPNRDQSTWMPFSAFNLPAKDWMFTVLFDYGEHDNEIPCLTEKLEWPCRADPFSTYRACFELRTYRLCRRILMFHHLPLELGLQDYLVSSTNFAFEETSALSYLKSVAHHGYLLKDGEYLNKSLPALELDYSRFPSQEELCSLQSKEIHSESLENLPYVDNHWYQWIDLNGEGFVGVLMEQATGWYYKPNISANQGQAKLGPIESIYPKPSAAHALSGTCFFADVDGSGETHLVCFDNVAPGFYSRSYSWNSGYSWKQFKRFTSCPKNINTSEMRFVDLTGDGLPDILVTEDYVFTSFASIGAEGYSAGFQTFQSYDEEKAPRLVFSDPEQSIYLADMSGDGLTDLLRIRNGEVCYWPNKGYGNFGAKVLMDQSPWFAECGNFDQRRVYITDVDGSGTSDIIYLSAEGVDLYLNLSGNRFGKRIRYSGKE